MDPIKYIAGKTTGQSSIVLHAPTTLLVSTPPEQPFNPETGKPNDPVAQGFQMADLLAVQTSAHAGVTAAQEALANAQAQADACDTLVADAQAAMELIGA